MADHEPLQAVFETPPQPRCLSLIELPAADEWQPLVPSRQHSCKVIEVQPGVVIDVTEDLLGYVVILARLRELIECQRGGLPVQGRHLRIGDYRAADRTTGRRQWPCPGDRRVQRIECLDPQAPGVGNDIPLPVAVARQRLGSGIGRYSLMCLGWNLPGNGPEQRFDDAQLHFRRSFAGKGDREDLFRMIDFCK